MKKLLSAITLLALLSIDHATAQLPNIDRTCTNCDRRYLDSLNVYDRRPIRVNQAGFRPQDNKYAYVADTKETTFKVIDANTGKEVPGGGNLEKLGTYPKPSIWVRGAFKSIGASLYQFGDTTTTGTETLYKADFTPLSTTGEYFLVVGKDTSATFHVHPSIYNAILENALKFFGVQRCGNTNSQLHGPCHLKDGSEIGHDLTGGWHDCGDHFKVSETLSYAAYALATTYLVYKDKAEDRYGKSYNDTTIVDGYPDILYEAKIGADYIYKLYLASKANGLIDQGDMYHSIAVGDPDHQFWDVPEKQDAQPQSKGGPDRHVAKGIGTASGMYAAALAYFAVGWSVYEPEYAKKLLDAAEDIYKKVMRPVSPYKKGTYKTTDELGGFYPGGSSETNMIDDAAAAALALWYATKDTMYQYDLYKNMDINDNSTNYMYNNEPNDAGPYFKAGYLGLRSGFYPGGWMTDFENVHSYVLFSFAKLILKDADVAKSYGINELERDTLLQRTTNALRRLTDDGSEGSKNIYTNRFGSVTAVPPYNLVWTSSDWGFNRYNLGAANAIFMLSEILPPGPEKEAYKNLALDNIYYNLGANPWDISFLMGAGDKNPNHPHNRAANPDGYNAGGMPYKYKCPKGALMGGRAPDKPLLEDWEDYTATETCIDFSVQLLMPAQSLAETLPPDNEGPLFSNIMGIPTSDTTAIITWETNEVALVTVFYDITTSATNVKSVQQKTASKGGSITLTGLTPGQTYYFFLEGIDTKQNITTDDNHGNWYQFTMTTTETKISGVTICQVDHRSAKIYWWSSNRMNGIVKFGKAKGHYTETATAKDGAVLFHEAELTNLEPGTTYYFKVYSGTAESEEYSFTTDAYATYADLDIYVKPSALQDENKCNPTNGWQNCSIFLIEIDNNDTTAFEDFELRFYLGANDKLEIPVSYNSMSYDGTGTYSGSPQIDFGPNTADATGAYYMPIKVNGKLAVSGRIIIHVKWLNATYSAFNNGWSLIAHKGEDAPEVFDGIDLEMAPYFKGSESEQLEINDRGDTVIAFTRDPYIPVYYHGKHIYGYGPDYTPEDGPQIIRKVDISFSSPFVSPIHSVEKVDAKTLYEATSTVKPTGLLDAVEMNGNPYPFKKAIEQRADSILFGVDTTLAYGNNYMEWVSWHNRNANQKTKNPYDCACAIARTNVEIDSITKPLEKRYLVFDKSKITGYKDKFVEVQISLLDSNLDVLKDEKNLNVELVSDDANVLFYTDPTATIPVNTVTLYDGVATIYVSSPIAVTTKIYAKHPNTKDYSYSPAIAELVIEDLPPWPIIDVAKIVDLNCDNIPDAMDITLSSEYGENQKFISISFVYEGTSYTTNKVKSLNGKSLVVEFDDIKDIVTNATGKITLSSDVQGQVKTVEDSYYDGMPPALLSATILERLDTATTDHLYLQFSEPISAPGTSFPLILYAKDGITQATTPTVLSAKLYNESKNIWDFEIAFDAGNGSLITAGMWGQLNPAGTITDLNGNGVAGLCTPEKIEILLKVLPIPMTYAVITDKHQNGYASHVDVTFAKPLDATHTPETLEIIFGTAKPETLTVEKSNFVLNGENLSIDLVKPFNFGNTAGNYEGTVPGGKSLEHAGLVTQYLGKGAALETNSVLAEDKVGPVFVTAKINQTSSADVLTITASEPLVIADTAQQFFRHKRAEKQSNITKGSFSTWNFAQNNTILTFIYMDDLSGSVMEGDFVRMGSMMTSTFKDANGNYPEFEVPWVLVNGNGVPRIKFDVKLRETINNLNSLNRTKVEANEAMRFYIKNAATGKFDMIQKEQVTQTGIDSADIGGAIFDVTLTAPRGTSIGDECAWENLLVKFNIPIYSNLGNYVNRFKQSFNVNPKQYLDANNQVVFAIEWANKAPSGIRTHEDRAVGTGAYIYKAEIEAKFSPNTSNPEIKNNQKLVQNFSTKTSFEQKKTFGIKRTK